MIKSNALRRFVASLALFTLISASSANAAQATPYWCYNGACCQHGSGTPHDCQYHCGAILSGWVTETLVNMSCSA